MVKGEKLVISNSEIAEKLDTIMALYERWAAIVPELGQNLPLFLLASC